MALSLPLINNFIIEKIETINNHIDFIEKQESSYRSDIIAEINVLKNTIKLQEYEIKYIKHNIDSNKSDDHAPPGLTVAHKNIHSSVPYKKPILLDISTQTDDLSKKDIIDKPQIEKNKNKNKNKNNIKNNWTVVTNKKSHR